jgi:hypothetical protein
LETDDTGVNGSAKVPHNTPSRLTVRPPIGFSITFAYGHTFYVDLRPMIKT